MSRPARAPRAGRPIRAPRLVRPAVLAPHIVENLSLAARCGAPAPMFVAVALAAAGVSDVGGALAFLRRHDAALRRLEKSPPSGLAALAELEPELGQSGEIARVRAELADHELRGRLLFRELVGRRSFFQVSALAIAGLELSRDDADLLEHLGVNTQLLDARIWPLTVTRRTAAHAGFARAVLAGIATMLNPQMAAAPVGGFMRFLDALEAAMSEGQTLERCLERALTRKMKVPGMGRPALGPDERNAQVFALARRFDRDRGPSFELARGVDDFFRRTKGLGINSAGLQGAIMRDIGFSPPAATAFCVLYFTVPILAHAAAGEGVLRAGRRPTLDRKRISWKRSRF